ncbi:MAG: ABC transporter substrate-binding protein [candidate division WOR-3 bacterium]|nr:ABC transporter substrate-binding protein [candidate division WOR-3 bacterium]MDH5683406.1 ABC transporter substrate-binding protein [candidate division WOR-3 bacterium]
MNKLLNLIIIVLALALVAVILYPQWQESRPVRIRFGCDSTVASVAFFVAKERGFFKDNKIIPEFVFSADPRKALDGLFQGEIDCGVFPWHLVLLRVAERQETLKVFVSEEFRTSLPIDALVVKPKSRITKLSDLKKKKIGYPNQLRELMPSLLVGAGVNPKDFNLMEMSNSELIAMLLQNKIDAAMVIEPERYRAIQESTSVIDDAALAKYISSPFPGAAIGYTRAYLTKNRKTCVKLKLACDAAIGYIDLNPEEARKILAIYLGFQEDELLDCRLPDFQKLVEMNRDAVQIYSDRLKANGIFNADVDVRPIFVEPILLRP